MRIITVFLLLLFSLSGAALVSEEEKPNTAATEADYQQALSDYKKAADAYDIKNLGVFAYRAYKLAFELHPHDKKNIAQLALQYGRSLPINRHRMAVLEKAHELYEEAWPEGDAAHIDALVALASDYARHRYDKDSTKLFKEARKIAENIYGKNSIEVAEVYVAESQSSQKHWKGIDSYGSKAASKARKILKKIPAEISELPLAKVYFAEGKFELVHGSAEFATKSLVKSLEIQNRLAPSHPATIINHALLIEAYERLGKRHEATKHCIAIAKTSPQYDNQELLPIFKPQQVFPKNRIEPARVELAFSVDETGFVTDPAITLSEGHKDFEKVALETILRYRYIPAVRDGQRIKVHGVKQTMTWTVQR